MRLLQTNRHVAQQAECFTNAPIFVKPTKNGRAVLLVAIYQCKSFLTTLPHQLLCGWVVYWCCYCHPRGLMLTWIRFNYYQSFYSLFFPASTSASLSQNLDRGFTSLLHLIDSCSPAHRCFHPHVPSHQPAASPHHLHPCHRHQSCLWNSQAPPLSEVNRCRWRRGIKLRSVWFSTCQPKILAGIWAG